MAEHGLQFGIEIVVASMSLERVAHNFFCLLIDLMLHGTVDEGGHTSDIIIPFALEVPVLLKHHFGSDDELDADPATCCEERSVFSLLFNVLSGVHEYSASYYVPEKLL